MAIHLAGEDTATGLRDWIKAELKDGPRQGYDSGKFFFSVSVGTIGALTALEKLNAVSQFDTPMILSMVLLFLSVLLSLKLVMPAKMEVAGDADLLKLYAAQISSTTRQVWVWFGVWFVGTVIGGFAVSS